MFPRIVTAKSGGKTHRYLKIVQSYRVDGKVRQRVVANFGNLENISKVDIDNVVNGLCREFDMPTPGEPPVFESAPSYGDIHAILHFWKELKLTQILEQRARSSRIQFDLVSHVQMMVTNRLCDPKSKLGLLSWLEHVHLPGVDREAVKYEHLLRTMDWLIGHKEEIEKELCNNVLTLFDQELDVVFYDLTSSYFETELTDELRKYGYSRDKRKDRPQLTLGMVTTRDGIPIFHDVFPGNTADKTTVQDVVRKLKARFPLRRAVFVGDRGMLTRENIAQIEAEGLEYIVAVNSRVDRTAGEMLIGFEYEVDEARSQWHEQIKAYREKGESPAGCSSEYEIVESQRLFGEQELDGRRLVVEHSESVARVSAKGRHDRLGRVKDGIEHVIGRLEKQDAGEAVRGRKLSEGGALTKIHDLLKENRLASAYQLEIDNGQLRVTYDDIALQWEAVLDGKLVVETNVPNLSPQEIISQYRDLREIEASFRELKSTVKMRPMYHWNTERIKAHVLVCFIALVIERSMRLTLRRADNKKKPKTVLESLSSLRRVTAKTTGGYIHGLTATTPEQLTLFKNLGVTPPKAADVS